MKPIRISLTAFGAYKNKEIIDFSELQGNHLFVISGPTGAGKTTIFDGICFALYGSASGSDRANTGMLRSHFADDNVHTSVDFQFEIRGRKFRVFRQLGHKKAGNKSKTGDKNELYMETENGEIPFVDRQIASEVNIKLEELIGLTEDQFKQIVMLPQGEFRKLLTSETENKEAILRRLFKTERYKAMHLLLKEKIDVLKVEFSSEKQRLNHYIESIQNSIDYRENAPIFIVLAQEYHHVSQIIAALKEEKEFLSKKIVENEKLYEEKKAASERQQEQYHQGLALNERFVLLESQKKEMNSLEQQSKKFTEVAAQLENAEKANSLIPYEHHTKERTHEWKSLIHKASEGETILNQASKDLASTQEFHQQLAAKEEERTNRKTQIHRLEEFLPIVKDANQIKDNLSNQSTQLKKMQQNIQQMENKRLEDVKKINELKATIRTQEKEMEPLNDKQIEIMTLREQYKVMKSYVDAQQQTSKSEQELKEVEQAYQKITQLYKEKEAIWLDNQALVLAGHLTDGDACPVCGSTHHPEKARASEQDISREQLDVWKEKMEKQLTSFHKAQSMYQSSKNDKKKALDQLAEYHIQYNVTEQSLKKLLKVGKELSQEVKDLEKVKTALQHHKQTLEELETSHEKNQEEKQKLEQTYHGAQLKYSTQEAAFKEKMTSIPAELQDLKELQSTLKQLQQTAEKADQQWRLAQNQLKTVEEAYTSAKATLKNVNTQLEAAKDAANKAQSIFQEKLNEAGFTTKEAYSTAKMPAAEQEKISNELEAYKEKKATLTQQLKELEVELKDKEKIDVSALQIILAESKKAYEEALTTWNQSKSQHTLVENFMKQIKASEQKTMRLEKELAAMKDVYNTVRGQNEKKISFERYLQIDYLDQIIQAANGRFKQLTNGQFNLERSDRQEAYGKQSGLAIDVFDGYTGQTRDVKTLSGGEKFIASLCLALGMSDVIQSYQGSISIETMFIDEGFGSLDEESLHRSIDALIQIQQTGRMIAVISHVEELKSLFPAMLKVTKTKEGYSKAAFVLK